MKSRKWSPVSQVFRSDVNRLLRSHAGECVSMYLPMVTAGPEVQQNPIRFKNLITEAEDELRRRDGGTSVLQQLRPLQELVKEDHYWQHQAQGLAVFVNEEELAVFRLPWAFRERLVVGKQFHIVPLLPLLQYDALFYVLALSRKSSRLFLATRDSISEVPADLPDSLAAVVGRPHHKGFSLHSFRARPRDSGTPVPHGHVEENETEELQRYFREVDKAVEEAVSDPDVPLVFAGVAEHFPVYQEISSHRRLLEGCIRGNPDDATPHMLHQKAWTLMEPIIRKRSEDELARFGEAKPAGRATDVRSEIARAAGNGQVETLLVALREDTNDPTDDVDSEVEQMVDAVFSTDGEVVVVDPSQLGESRVACILRFPLPVESA